MHTKTQNTKNSTRHTQKTLKKASDVTNPNNHGGNKRHAAQEERQIPIPKTSCSSLCQPLRPSSPALIPAHPYPHPHTTTHTRTPSPAGGSCDSICAARTTQRRDRRTWRRRRTWRSYLLHNARTRFLFRLQHTNRVCLLLQEL